MDPWRQHMKPTDDRLGLAFDEGVQVSTLRAGWRFYQRAAAREDAQQALSEWVNAFEAVLDLGVAPTKLFGFRDALGEALAAAVDESLKRSVRTLVATLEPHALTGVSATISALRKKHSDGHEPRFATADAVAVDTGVSERSAERISTRLRTAA
jgi:hypothetical protein